MSIDLRCGDALALLRETPEASVQTCVTSPPYWGLRDYGVAGQLGLERTPEEYVASMVEVFREVRRVLRDDGTLWLNLGDSYCGSGKGGNPEGSPWAGFVGNKDREKSAQASKPIVPDGLKPKDLVGIPWRVAFALQADGWVLRQEVIWAKPNPMPESVTDRCTKSHEQLFMFSKASWRGQEQGRFAGVNDCDARWIAGLVDCEGSIVVKRVQHEGRGDTFAPQVSIGSTCRALLERVAEIVGYGNVLERTGQNAPMHYWQVGHSVARDFLLRIYPFLVVKPRQARIGIYLDSLTYYRGGQKPERKQRTQNETDVLLSLWRRNKELNHFGDPDLSDVPEPQYGRWGAGPRYYYDAKAIAEESSCSGRVIPPYGPDARDRSVGDEVNDRATTKWLAEGMTVAPTRNARSVWTIATSPYPEAHFATFPPELPRRCILAGSKEGDTVLDPFAGAGTTGLVADRLGRNFIGLELNPSYVALARRRIAADCPLFAQEQP